ncbi:arylsulfatase [Lentisphaera profundi]|uniref:Arylsulfatase n=1 Tax=Lentisphaera profundi TaxID=1658616 RepID=A0ABY7VRP1_9BACT|nr:arylsulfatase [Lentisphaera profundi]WDE96394.1 arylsulfatase [Lentisphaera profundi]
MNKIFLLCTFLIGATLSGQDKPNIVIVMTDDQGYGDLSCHGNPIIKTPNIDKFYKNSLRLTNYHVDPTCAPTRSALMTGRYSARVGVWHTVQGRHLMREREITMANVLKDNGYAAGIFGKWHLGDAYPYRPEDRGFTHVVTHGAGGVGQTPDYWGNDYFNDTYYVNGKFVKFNGFCTDIWFTEAKKFMKQQIAKKKPFFTYITPNAPHGPMRAPQKYLDMYNKEELIKGKKQVAFYGMITNIDDNFGELRKFLQDEGVEDNTILIYTTDNGSSSGSALYNAGMTGAKNSNFDGGHRVPFIFQWPNGKLTGNRDINQLTAHMDILPTLIDMLSLKAPKIEFDGTSLTKIIKGDQSALRDRVLLVESQRVKDPEKWRNTAVMSDEWRLLNAKQLYNIRKDPAQKNNVAAQYPEVLQRLSAAYDARWVDLAKEHYLFSPLVIGAKEENPVTLTSHDQMVEKGLPKWNQPHIVSGGNHLAPWVVRVQSDGEYEISVRRWAAEADKGINEKYVAKKALGASKAFIKIADIDLVKEIPEGAKEVTFKVKLKTGQQELFTGFIKANDKRESNFYTYVLNKSMAQGDTKNWQSREGLGLPLAAPITVDYPEEILKWDKALNGKSKK